jgi:N utilization substance protein B
MLYRADLLGSDDGVTGQIGGVTLAEEIAPDEETRTFAERLVEGVILHQAAIDATLTEALTSWTIERLGYVERAVLRIAVYEMEFESGTPFKVALDEAIELAKKYCDTGSTKLINGALDRARVLIEQRTKYR